MAAGTKKAFDFENVLATMGSTLSNIGIAKVTSSEVMRTTLNSLSNTALDSVAHNNYQLESMAANLLGSAVQYGAQKGMEAFSSQVGWVKREARNPTFFVSKIRFSKL